MPKVEGHRANNVRGRERAEEVQSKKHAPLRLGEVKTKELPGHLPKVTQLEVEALATKSAKLDGVKSASIVAEVQLGVPMSGIVNLPSGQTLAINDDKGVYEVRPGEEPRLLFKLKDGEGLAVDDKGKYVYALDEKNRSVHKLEVRTDEKGRLALRDTDDTKKLPKLKGESNTGWEGICFLPKELAGGKKDCLVCVHEGSPRRIGIYELPDLDNGVTLKLPKSAKGLLPDLADIAVDPKTGHLFVVSDQSRTVVELAIVRESKAATQGLLESVELKVVSSIDLPISANKKPEGLHFDEKGRLWVALDYENEKSDTGKALVLEQQR
jgi:hypothetical protein